MSALCYNVSVESFRTLHFLDFSSADVVFEPFGYSADFASSLRFASGSSGREDCYPAFLALLEVMLRLFGAIPYGLPTSSYRLRTFFGDTGGLRPALMPVRNFAMFAYSFGTSEESKSSPSEAFSKLYFGCLLIRGTLA